MYRFILLAVLVICIIINLKLHKNAEPVISSPLLPYVNRFLEFCDYYHTDCSEVNRFSIQLVDIPDRSKLYKLLGLEYNTTVGLCRNISKEIEVSLAYFKSALKEEIEQLVFHELGHCILNLEHTKDSEVNIMNPYTLPGYMYLNNYNQLINELFSCNQSCPEVIYNQDHY